MIYLDLVTCAVNALNIQLSGLRHICCISTMNASNSYPDFEFSTFKGHQLTRSVLQPLLPYGPHDDQLEGICKMADGVDLVALMQTGSGRLAILQCTCCF